MNRVNIYGFPHKGLKNGLSQLLFATSKADITSESSVAQVKTLAAEMVTLLELHQDAEDEFVLPELEAKVSGSTDYNRMEHERLHGQVDTISKIASELEVGGAEGQMAQLFDVVGGFFSDYMRHMNDEEGEINQFIWDNFTDQEILSWQAKIMDKLTPPQKMSWFKFIVPALNPMERMVMMGGVRENAPVEVYMAVMTMLEQHMSEEELQPLKSLAAH